MSKMLWTEQQVIERIAECVDTISRLPMVYPHGYRSSMPEALREFGDVFAIAVTEGGKFRDTKTLLGPPEPSAIDRSVEVLSWLRRVKLADRRLLWARATRHNYWWKLSSRFRKCESTLKRHHKHTVRGIAEWLNSAELKKSA